MLINGKDWKTFIEIHVKWLNMKLDTGAQVHVDVPSRKVYKCLTSNQLNKSSQIYSIFETETDHTGQAMLLF